MVTGCFGYYQEFKSTNIIASFKNLVPQVGPSACYPSIQSPSPTHLEPSPAMGGGYHQPHSILIGGFHLFC